MSDEPAEPVPDRTVVSTMLMEEARRLVARQDADLDTLRGKVATVLTGSAIVAAVFGAALRTHHPNGASIFYACAIAAFVLTVGVCLFIVWPRTWHAEHSIAEWLEECSNGLYPQPWEIALSLAAGFERWRAENHDTLTTLQSAFALACALLGLQVAFWAVAILLASS